jgi:hypothetical protein
LQGADLSPQISDWHADQCPIIYVWGTLRLISQFMAQLQVLVLQFGAKHGTFCPMQPYLETVTALF